MGADLSIRNMFRNRSILLLDDQLVELEHSYASDRVRRILYDRVDSVARWRELPVGRMITFALLLGLPGSLLLLANDEVATIFALIVLIIFAIVELRYIYAGKTTLQIRRAGREYRIVGVVSPRKVERLLRRLRDDIPRVQAQVALAMPRAQ